MATAEYVDRITEVTAGLKAAEAKADALESLYGRISAASGSVAGSGCDSVARDRLGDVCASLADDADEAADAVVSADAQRQTVCECIDFIPDTHTRRTLYAALAIASDTGHVQMSALARSLGCSRMQATRYYQRALVELESTMRQHKCL